MNQEIINFYVTLGCLILKQVIFCIILIHPLRFSKSKSFLLSITGFTLLYLPQFLFPETFMYIAKQDEAHFIISFIYWCIFMFSQYAIIFLLAKRNWMHFFFLYMIWDVTSSIFYSFTHLSISCFFSGDNLFTSLISIALLFITSIIAAILIRIITGKKIRSANKILLLIFLIYNILRLLLTLEQILMPSQESTNFLISSGIFITVFLFFLLIIYKITMKNYIEHKARYYIQIMTKKWPSKKTENTLFLYLDSLYNQHGIKLHFENKVSGNYEIADGFLSYLIILCSSILLFKCTSSSPASAKAYLILQEEMGYLLISTGITIENQYFPSLHRYSILLNILRQSWNEILINYILKNFMGKIKYLDSDQNTMQIRMILQKIPEDR